MKKKILIIVVVALVLIVALAFMAIFSRRDPGNNAEATTAPGGNTADGTSSGDVTDIENGLKDNIPEDTDFGDAEVCFLTWSEVSMNEFYVDGQVGDIIGDAIYERNCVVEERLGVKLKYEATTGDAGSMGSFIKKAEIDVTSGACEYDIYAGYSRTAPAMALNGVLADLTTLDYIDFSKPWWPDTLINQCLINDRLYYCSGDISTNLLWMMIATFFNKELIATHGLENPYELVKNNKWTIDKLIEMTTGKYTDLDGGGLVDDGDFFGYSIYNVNIDAFFTAADFIAFDRNNAGEVIISPDFSNQNIYDLINKLGNYFTATSDVRSVNSTGVRAIFFEQRSIFTMDRVFIVAGKDNGPTDKIEFEYGILPNPKLNEAQENFSTNVGHPFTMYAISSSAFNTDACAAVLECLGSESYRRVTPMVFETAMKIKYASDEVTTEMYDILRSTVSFDLGRLYSTQANDVYSSMRAQVINNSGSFASQFKGMSKLIEKGVASINAAYFN